MKSPNKAISLPLMLTGILIASAALRASPPDQKTSIAAIAKEFDLTEQLLSASKQGSGGGDPLKAISGLMTGVHGDLSQFLTGQPVQEKEKRVVKTLDELIAALEKHCNGSGTGRGNRPGTGRRQSVIASGDPRGGDLHAVAEHGRAWAQLPPKEREIILQSKTEGFPPGYEALLQSYYQQLAQEKPADDKPAVAPSANSGAP
jgi:hypothetical protein